MCGCRNLRANTNKTAAPAWLNITGDKSGEIRWNSCRAIVDRAGELTGQVLIKDASCCVAMVPRTFWCCGASKCLGFFWRSKAAIRVCSVMFRYRGRARTWADERNTGSDRMRATGPTSARHAARAHGHTLTHTPLLTWRTAQPLTKSLCVCVFGVYGYEASKDNWDSEAVMCEGWDQTRSSGTASLEEFVLSHSSARKSAARVFSTRGREGGKERMLFVTAYVRMLTFRCLLTEEKKKRYVKHLTGRKTHRIDECDKSASLWSRNER